jgi:hypothetical protein
MLNQNSREISFNIAKRASFSPDLGILLCTARDRRASVVLRWCTWPRWRRPGWWNSKTAKRKMLTEGRPEKTKHILFGQFCFRQLRCCFHTSLNLNMLHFILETLYCQHVDFVTCFWLFFRIRIVTLWLVLLCELQFLTTFDYVVR